MAKKQKKIYKPNLLIAPKVSINRKWTVWREQETKARHTAALNEIKKLFIESLIKNNQYLSTLVLENKNINFYKTKLLKNTQKLTKKSSKSYIKNYCLYVGRSRSTNRKVYMARHVFRKFARFGMLPGFMKERS